MVSQEQQSKLEAESKMDELLRAKELLEEENMAQKHLIHLEKLKAEKEYAEMREQKSRLMAELEQEKAKLEGDINKLQKNKELRMETSKRDSIVSVASSLSEGSILKGSELMRVAMMLQEASAICKGLNKPLVSNAAAFSLLPSSPLYLFLPFPSPSPHPPCLIPLFSFLLQCRSFLETS